MVMRAEEREATTGGKLELDTLQTRDDLELTAHDEPEVSIHPSYPEQRVKIGRTMAPRARAQLNEHLRQSPNVFAWTVQDIRGQPGNRVIPEITLYQLSVDPTFKPVQQRPRQFSSEKDLAIREEIEKLLNANIIEEILYPTWLANVVMVKKANGK